MCLMTSIVCFCGLLPLNPIGWGVVDSPAANVAGIVPLADPVRLTGSLLSSPEGDSLTITASVNA